MICRTVLALLAVALGLPLGWFSLVVAGEPTRLPSPIRGPAREPVSAGAPAESLTVGPDRQIAHLSQPEYSGSFAGLSGPVPVERLVHYALANNPEIRAARYYAGSLGARVPQAASLPDPQLITTAFLESIQTAAGPQEVAMSLSQKLPWFGKRGLRSQVAYHDAMAAYSRAAAVELKVIEQVKRAYYDIYFLQRAIEVTRTLEPRLEDIIDISKTKYETNVAGAGLESVLQAQIELSALKTRLIELKQAKAEAQARLAGILHLPPSTRIDAVAEFDRTRLAHTARLLVELAGSYQPELDARRREISRDRTSVELACRDYWPDATVALNWYEIGSPGLSPVATGEDAFSLGVGFNIPLYRKRLDAAVREARYKTARSAQQYAATLDQVQAEVQALYAQFLKHHQVLEILGSQIVPDAARTLELSIEAYDLGKLEFQQMIKDYDNLLKYQIEYHKREALREQAIASLERHVGTAATTWPTEPMAESEPIPAP